MSKYTMGVTTTGGAHFVFLSQRNEPAPLSGNFVPDQNTIALSSAAIQYDRIVTNPNILDGEPYIRGTRVPVYVILDGLAEGLTIEALIEHYPRLTSEDIRAALEFVSEMAIRPGE